MYRLFFFSSLIFFKILIPPFLYAEDLPQGQIGLSPSIFENIQLGTKPVNETIRFFNFREEPVTVQVSVHNWTINANNKLELLPPSKQSLDQWITINPLHFTVPAKQSRPVRFSIRPRVKPDPGEHRAIIYFSEAPSTKDTTAQKTIKTRFRVGVGIYATSKPVEKKAVLHSFRYNKHALSADIENTGNTHVRLKGQFIVWNENNLPQESDFDNLFSKSKEKTKPEGFAGRGILNSFPVLPGTRRTVETPLPQPEKSGTYIVAVKDTLAGTPRTHLFKLAK